MLSAGHSNADFGRGFEAFTKVGVELGVAR